MSVLALAFFSDIRATLQARLLSKGRSLLAAASTETPPAIPVDRPYLLRDAGLGFVDPRLDDRWRKVMGDDPVYRSHWML